MATFICDHELFHHYSEAKKLHLVMANCWFCGINLRFCAYNVQLLVQIPFCTDRDARNSPYVCFIWVFFLELEISASELDNGTLACCGHVISVSIKFHSYFYRQPFLFSSQMKRQYGSNFGIAFCILATILFVSVKVHLAKKARYSRPGSVADLVRRGQLRSDRRGMYDPDLYFLACLWLCSSNDI